MSKEYELYGERWKAQVMHHTKEEIVLILGAALVEKAKQIATLQGEVQRLYAKTVTGGK